MYCIPFSHGFKTCFIRGSNRLAGMEVWPLATRTTQKCFMARFVGSVKKKGRFVPESIGSGQTSGSPRIYIKTVNHSYEMLLAI